MTSEVLNLVMANTGLNENDAFNLIKEVRNEIINNPEEAEDIMLEELGLELDYLIDII